MQPYNENSLDSKITQLLIQHQVSEADRTAFRAEILKDLQEIKTNTHNLDARLMKVEDTVADFIDRQETYNSEIQPVLDAYRNAKGGFWTVKNILVAIAFLLSLYTTFKSL